VSGGGHGEGLHLWLLRHAKAAPDPPHGGTDHERPLTSRGRRDAAALGARIRAGDLGFGARQEPRLVLTSTAARTTETAVAVADALGAQVDRRRRLYYGSPTDVLAELRTLDPALRSVMVVGHNPAIHAVALELLGADDEGHAAPASFPTCAVALLRVDVGSWAGLGYGTATLLGHARPPFEP